jgi:hypothetical protein
VRVANLLPTLTRTCRQVFLMLVKTCVTFTIGALKSGFSKVPSMG